MSAWNSAKCMKCGHIGNKFDMVKVMKDGFVHGYAHDECSSFAYSPTSVKDAISDAIYSNHSAFMH